MLVLVITPVALISRNLSQIRATNGPMLKQFAGSLSQGLPSTVVVLSDDSRRLLLAQAASARTPSQKSIIFVDTASLEYPQYHHFLKKLYGSKYPFEVPKRLTQKVDALAILRLVSAMTGSNGAYYLHLVRQRDRIERAMKTAELENHRLSAVKAAYLQAEKQKENYKRRVDVIEHGVVPEGDDRVQHGRRVDVHEVEGGGLVSTDEEQAPV